ncbi:hypothetical protein KFZ70_04205 [Tamlana fucoidanivorans]|uniref:hypothetical protein n=1 Tax=Allotamlana fucoidanivorans TaxID=2583814 RepID=UPI0026BB6129
MLISIVITNKSDNFGVSKHAYVRVYIALESTYTNNNTPSMPLYNAHSEGFFF